MQQQMAEAQEQQAAQVITGSAGGGKVTVEVTGAGEYRKVSISPDAVDADDVELLEELVEEAGRKHPGVTFRVGAVLGEDPRLVEILLDRAEHARPCDPPPSDP